MPWEDAPNGGFTPPEVKPWLPLGDTRLINVASQRSDRQSVLHFVRDLIAVRRSQPDLTTGDYRRLNAPPGGWAWRRGTGTVVAINLSDHPLSFEGVSGSMRFSTSRGVIEGASETELRLEPWEGAICSSALT